MNLARFLRDWGGLGVSRLIGLWAFAPSLSLLVAPRSRDTGQGGVGTSRRRNHDTSTYTPPTAQARQEIG